jgi:hypothetical protein
MSYSAAAPPPASLLLLFKLHAVTKRHALLRRNGQSSSHVLR